VYQSLQTFWNAGGIVAANGASSILLNLRRQRLLQAFENRKLPPLSFPEEFKKA
jgi:hypothetical protein